MVFNWAWVLTALYGLLSLAAIYQLGRIIAYRHKWKSFHFGFLLAACVWTILRLIYFTVIYPGSVPTNQCTDVIVFGIPLVVQCGTFSLLIVFYAYWVHKRKWDTKYKKPFWAFAIVTNSIYTLLFCVFFGLSCSKGTEHHHSMLLLQIEAILSGSIFSTLTILLAIYGFNLSKLSRAGVTRVKISGSSSRNVTFHIVTITCIIGLIFLTRAISDFLTIDRRFRAMITNPLTPFLFCRYVFWEILPTAMVLVYFRDIPKPSVRTTPSNASQQGPSAALLNSTDTIPFPKPLLASTGPNSPGLKPSFPSLRGHIWDDPARYDSDDEGKGQSWRSPLSTPTPIGSSGGLGLSAGHLQGALQHNFRDRIFDFKRIASSEIIAGSAGNGSGAAGGAPSSVGQDFHPHPTGEPN